MKIAPGLDLAKLIGDGRIATGEVTSVPVGKYAKSALEKLGLWASVEKKFAMADNVRAALAPGGARRGRARHRLRDRRQGRAGREDRRRVPADSHPAIVYPVAATVTAKPEAAAYLDFLRGGTAKAVFEQYGFTFLVRPTS